MNAMARHVLPNSAPITESFYRSRVSDIIARIQRENALNDRELADLVFCSPETITNARNGDNKLSGPTLFNLMLASPNALEGLLHYFDRRSVPLGAKCDTDALTAVSAAVHSLAVAASHNGPNDRDFLEMEAVVDAALESLSAVKSRCLTIREQRS